MERVPNIRCIGFPRHHPTNTTTGIQNSVNWILRSIALARVSSSTAYFDSLSVSGYMTSACTLRRRRSLSRSLARRRVMPLVANTRMIALASAEKLMNGRKMRPNHLCEFSELKGQKDGKITDLSRMPLEVRMSSTLSTSWNQLAYGIS